MDNELKTTATTLELQSVKKVKDQDDLSRESRQSRQSKSGKLLPILERILIRCHAVGNDEHPDILVRDLESRISISNQGNRNISDLDTHIVQAANEEHKKLDKMIDEVYDKATPNKSRTKVQIGAITPPSEQGGATSSYKLIGR